MREAKYANYKVAETCQAKYAKYKVTETCQAKSEYK